MFQRMNLVTALIRRLALSLLVAVPAVGGGIVGVMWALNAAEMFRVQYPFISMIGALAIASWGLVYGWLLWSPVGRSEPDVERE